MRYKIDSQKVMKVWKDEWTHDFLKYSTHQKSEILIVPILNVVHWKANSIRSQSLFAILLQFIV